MLQCLASRHSRDSIAMRSDHLVAVHNAPADRVRCCGEAALQMWSHKSGLGPGCAVGALSLRTAVIDVFEASVSLRLRKLGWRELDNSLLTLRRVTVLKSITQKLDAFVVH